jgi:hypothetical protein
MFYFLVEGYVKELKTYIWKLLKEAMNFFGSKVLPAVHLSRIQ